MTTTTTSVEFRPPLPSKKDILERLLSAGHITFDEMWVLLEDTTTKHVVLPKQDYNPYIQPITNPYPFQPSDPTWVGDPPPIEDTEYKSPIF